MKCPKCQNEINGNARFCTKCGCDLAQEMARAAGQKAEAKVCAKCGAAFMAGARFCTKCGTPIAAAPVQPAPSQPKPTPAPSQPKPSVQPQPPAPSQPKPVADAEKSGQPEKKKNAKGSAEKDGSGKKAGGGLIAVAVVLFLLVAAAGTACFLVWNGTLAMPSFGGIAADDEGTDETGTESTTETQALDIDEGALFAETDALLEEGKSKAGVDTEVVNSMEILDSAIHQFAQKAEEAGDISLAADRIEDAYAAYVSAVIKHKDMMDGQGLSGSIYSQIMSEMENAGTLADELSAMGCAVDTALLESEKDAFAASYRTRVIEAFDEFTTREAWSRTEAWNLMSETADSMFDMEDLDDPLRLRYAYALSWWIQKQIETELANGTITEKGAAIKIANMIDVMDYDPMMIDLYIRYMKASSEDCSEVERAYDEIIQHIGQTQGFWIGEDVDLAHFWYFNDFGEHSVDDRNGVTPENRQWIRDRMSSVDLMEQ